MTQKKFSTQIVNGGRCRVIYLRKKSGQQREIYIPNKLLKVRLKKCVTGLSNLQESLCGESVHGFRKNRSPVTAALVHRGYTYTLTVDLKDFFPSVTLGHMKKTKDTQHILQILSGVNTMPVIAPVFWVNNHLVQGYPTSPLLANLAAVAMDEEIETAIAGKGVYTRYADDLSISSNDKDFLVNLRDVVLPPLISSHNFIINPRKTRLQWSGFGNRRVAGIMIAPDGRLTIPRKLKRRLRVLRHHQKIKHPKRNWRQCRGLEAYQHFVQRASVALELQGQPSGEPPVHESPT